MQPNQGKNALLISSGLSGMRDLEKYWNQLLSMQKLVYSKIVGTKFYGGSFLSSSFYQPIMRNSQSFV